MRGRQLCRYCCLLLVWFALAGIWRGAGKDTAAPFPKGATVRVSGTVYRREFKRTNQSIYLKNVSFLSQTAEILPESKNWNRQKIIVYLGEKEKIRIGASVLVEGSCDYPKPQRNPGGFNAMSYYGAMGVKMFLKKASVLSQNTSVYPLRNRIADLRDTLRRALESAGEDTDAGILSAMLLGDRGILDAEIKNLYQDAGIIHLLAISGLHISLTGMALYHFLRRLGCSYAVTGVICAGTMAGYACMTGYPVSAVRAVLMFLIFLLSQVKGRTYDMPTGLAAAAVAILFAHESALTQAGFLLSFGAVCGVILSLTWESRRWKNKVMGISAAVQMTTLPLIAWFYYQIPPYALLLNLCIVWMMPFVLGFGIAGMTAALFARSAGKFILAPAHYLLLAIEMICEKARLLPFSTIVTGKPDIWKLAAYYLCLAAFFYLCEKRKKRTGNIQYSGKIQKIDLIKCSFAIILLSGVFTGNRRNDFAMTFLDVGQGDGCCIENENRSVWMTDGGSSSETEVAAYCLEPFLKSRGIDEVDYWMVSHGDTDHVSGLLEILHSYVRGLDGRNAAGITVGCILLPDTDQTSEAIEEIAQLAGAQRIPVRFLKAGDSVTDGRMTVRVLAPDPTAAYGDVNEASMVTEVAYGEFQALLTGDVEGEGENVLLQNGALRDADVLKVAHHGSRNSTGEGFLAKVQPELAVISCGEDNRYGHPHEELLTRLKKAGCLIARTDRQGAVMITVDRRGYVAKTQLTRLA